jgi:O-antigen biosynthesis protein
MKVSVIVASFNRPKLLSQALASIQAQTHPDVELILVDESDLFNARDLLAGYNRPFQLVQQFVSPKDRREINRLGVNMNTGLAMAKGDLVCFLADDDYYFPTWIEKAVEAEIQ